QPVYKSALTGKPKVFKKLEQVQDTYPMSVTVIGGKIGETTGTGLILDQPNIQVFQKKLKPPKEVVEASTN
ncbi:MAG: hypothetical protein F6J98_14955, partial [Moorea sp. SIO4G2]|nr:hypothetical protein [Moorena sp. SIO4G2]